MKSESKGVVRLFTVIFIVLVLFIFGMIYAVKKISSSENLTLDLKNKNAIAVVEIKGPIMDSRKSIEQLLKAEEDESTPAIIVRIDSPGGAVGPVQEIYEEIRRIDQVKPVYASMGLIAASGGYYIAAATRKIYANPGTLTGSIGVILQFPDLSRLYEWAKISMQTVKGGRYKDVGNPARKMTEEEKKLMQNMVEEVHAQFRDDIQKARGDKIKGNLEDYAQGQVFSGKEALRVGLVDELAGLWEAGRQIHKELKLKDKFHLKYMKEKKKFQFLEFFDEAEEAISNIKMNLEYSDIPVFMYKSH